MKKQSLLATHSVITFLILIISLTLSFNAEAKKSCKKGKNQTKCLQKQIDEIKEQNSDLQQQFDALNQFIAPKAIRVDCAAGDTVTGALDSVADSPAPVTITIVGVCTETVLINRDDVTLQGTSTTDGILGVSGEVTVHLIGAKMYA